MKQKTIRIINHKNIYLMADVNDSKIDKYMTNGLIDLSSDTYKKANKNPIRDFTLMVRVSKKINGKQKFKKMTSSFTDTTLKVVLEILKDKPKELLMKFDLERNESEEKTNKENVVKETAILDDVWDEFYDHKINGTDELRIWKLTTAKNYKSFYNQWIRKTTLGKTAIIEISKDQCSGLISEVKSKRKLRTATTAIEVLRPLLDWYFEKYEIDKANPVPKKKKNIYELKNERIVELSLLQVKTLYEVIDNYDYDFFRNIFMWLRTGRRRGEVISLQMETIDIVDKTFMVEARNNKAGEDMTYTLRPELEVTLPEEYEDHDYLFESPVKKGYPIHFDSVTKHWTRIKEKVEQSFINKREAYFKLNGKRMPFSELHLHDIRHIIAGVLKKAGVPEETRAKVLGHKRSGITNRYGIEYYGDIDEAYQLFLDIVYGVVPEDTKWGT